MQDLELRPDGEEVVKRFKRKDVPKNARIVDFSSGAMPGQTSGWQTNRRCARQAEFWLPEMAKPVMLPASRQGQIDGAKALMAKYRPNAVYGRDYTLNGGAIR